MPPVRSSRVPIEQAAIITLDGVGEWSTTTFGVGEGSRIRLIDHIAFPHSLGLLYSAFTYYCGFKVNSGEYKLMGLAPYGQPVYRETDPGASHRPEERRQFLAQHGLLHVLPGADHDREAVSIGSSGGGPVIRSQLSSSGTWTWRPASRM